MEKLTTIAILLSLTSLVFSYPSGAPAVVCHTMVPHHGVDPQATVPIHSISVSKTDAIYGDDITGEVKIFLHS